MGELSPTAKGRVTTIENYLREVAEGMEGRGSLKRHPDGMDVKLKNVVWALDRLKTEAAGEPIVQEISARIDDARAKVAAYREALKSGTPAAPPPGPSAPPPSRVVGKIEPPPSGRPADYVVGKT